jgi:hypothetical protein
VPLELGDNAVVSYRGWRCIGARASQPWSTDRRQRYLLAPDVGVPISIDKSVTPEAEPTDPPNETIELLGVAFAPDGDRELLDHWRYPGIPSPSSPLSDDWLVLGYDVCDTHNTSALSNCAPTDSSVVPGFWRLALNRHHLLTRILDADVFRKSSNRRVPEHAPFVVMAVLTHVPTI